MEAPQKAISFVGTAADDRAARNMVLRVVVFLALVLGVTYFMASPSSADRIKAEARSYLAPCTTADCRAAADRFVASYQAAMQGDSAAQL